LAKPGLRAIQIWAPDVQAPGFRSEAHRQSLAVSASARATEDQAFIDAVSDRAMDEAGRHLDGRGRQGPRR